jgi:hypothetical protein
MDTGARDSKFHLDGRDPIRRLSMPTTGCDHLAPDLQEDHMADSHAAVLSYPFGPYAEVGTAVPSGNSGSRKECLRSSVSDGPTRQGSVVTVAMLDCPAKVY